MPVWKVLIICILAIASLVLALSTVLVTLSHEGQNRWLWMGGLVAATAFTGTLLTLFLRSASGSLDAKIRRGSA